MTRRPSFLAPLLLTCTLATAASAQYYYFGRNKVQYTDFDWQVLSTEHFDIYYYPEMKELAERGAFFAEEAQRELEVKFNHTLGSRVPLIFYSSHLYFQQTNVVGGLIPEGVGGFFEFLKGRVVIPSDGSAAQFRHVIRHELVHVFSHSKLARVLTDHRKPQDRMPPLWFIEGLAEYWSTHWDAQAEMVMRDAVLNNTVVGLDDMNLIYGSFLMYKEGQNALMFMAKRYGEEKILLLLENMWRSASFTNVFEDVLGITYKEFDEEWLYALRKQYFPLLAQLDAPSKATRTVVGTGFNTKPVVFEEGTRRDVYFISNRTGYTGIYRRSLDSRDLDDTGERLVEGETSDQLEAFHPFRTRIDVSRSGLLAFSTKSGETDALHLYDVHTLAERPPYRFRSIVSIGSTSWAPDGRRLAFSGIDPAGHGDLYILDTQTSGLQRLTNDYYDDRDPAWSPDGRCVVFTSDRSPQGTGGAHNLFRYDLASGLIEYLTSDEAGHATPAWSGDGRHLAFTSDEGGIANIWVMTFEDPPDSSGRLPQPASVRQLTRFTTSAFDPAWTASGDLVFTTFENFSFQIRHLPGAARMVDTAASAGPILLAHEGRPWEAQTLSGGTSTQRFRYEGDYSLDVAQSAVSTDPVFGTTGGAFLALSDVLGNDQYYILVTNTASAQSEILSSFNVAISRVSRAQRASLAYGIYRFSGRRYDLTAREEYYYERIFGGYFALSYPLSRFQRVEAGVSLSNSSRDIAFVERTRKSLLLSNSIGFVHDNSLWVQTGPVDGARLNITLAYTSDIQYSNVNYYTIIGDYRTYVRLGLASTLASRYWIFFNGGKDSRRFVMGGSWDLRGYPRWSIRGEKLWLVSQELRFPLLHRLSLFSPVGGLHLWPLRGAIFVDVGGAWDRVYTETLGAIGVGLRMNIGGFLVLRYDVGKRLENNLNSVQKGVFHQFFFGWDF